MSRIETDFGKARKSETISIKPQYFIFSEGNVTERKYFKKLNSSITEQLVKYNQILRWNGQLPTFMGGESTMPILNFGGVE